jgi:hypothetical protein
MKRLIVLLALILFVIPLVAGCGQKQEAQNKAPVIKPMSETQEDEDIDAEEETADTMPDSVSPADVKTVGEAAVEKAETIQAAQSDYQAQKPSEVLVLADFDTGEKPSNIGGNFGSWNRDPSDPTQFCKEGFDNATRHGDKGFGMKLSYSVDSPNPAYNGFWMMLPNLDASKYDTLNLWVKGDAQAGFTSVFKIELKNAAKQVGRYYVSNVTDQWKQISIPLAEFKGLVDKTALTELVVVFEDRMATSKKGTIYIDDIALSKK